MNDLTAVWIVGGIAVALICVYLVLSFGEVLYNAHKRAKEMKAMQDTFAKNGPVIDPPYHDRWNPKGSLRVRLNYELHIGFRQYVLTFPAGSTFPAWIVNGRFLIRWNDAPTYEPPSPKGLFSGDYAPEVLGEYGRGMEHIDLGQAEIVKFKVTRSVVNAGDNSGTDSIILYTHEHATTYLHDSLAYFEAQSRGEYKVPTVVEWPNNYPSVYRVDDKLSYTLEYV